MTTQPNGSVSYDSSPLSTRDLRRDLPARRHRLLGVAVALMVVVPGIALAQSPDRPVVELVAQAAGSTPPPTAWRLVKSGREVWVTTNTGSLVHGKVAAISDSGLIIREQDREVTIRLDEVRLVEGRDSKRNGLLIGAVSGAVVGGGLLGFVAASGGGSACNGDCGTLNAVVGGAVAGAAVGGLFGLMVDGLIKGRQTLFWGSTTVVTPVITPDRKSIDVAIRWR